MQFELCLFCKMDQLDWYHGNISRHIAEALLIANGREGSFLLRNVQDAYCLSVRASDAVKHFKVDQTEEGITFAHSIFDDVAQLLQVFANQVILCSDSRDLSKNLDNGTLITLKYPYPKQVEEPDNYDQTMMLHSTIRVNAPLEDLKPQACPLASKSGFLTKRGGSIKTWKLRWFVIMRNEFSYFMDRTSDKPIRTIDLKKCCKLEICEVQGKEHCFRLEFPDRTWYFSANSRDDLREWTSIIQWKLKQNKPSIQGESSGGKNHHKSE